MSERSYPFKPDKPRTINELIEKSIEMFPDKEAMAIYDDTPITYKELGEKIKSIANILKEIGIRKGDKIAIVGENSVNWGIAYLSIVSIGAVAVPVLPDFPGDDIQNILNHSESKLLFVTRPQAEKLDPESLRTIKTLITLDDFTIEKPPLTTVTFTDFINRTIEKVSVAIFDIGEKAGLVGGEISENDLASIIYTSGTTGLSKGVMLTHGNFCANVRSVRTFVDLSSEDRFLSILPLSHAYEFSLGFLLPLSKGACVYYLGKMPTPTILKRACSIVKPTTMIMVPLIMEKIFKHNVKAKLEKNFLIKSISRTPFMKKIIYKKAAKKIIEVLGGELRIIAFGGAPLNSEVERFLKDSRFPYLSGYGLTEAAPLVTGEELNEVRLGSVGYPVPEAEVKIFDPSPEDGVGEIWVRGPNVMKGYFKNKKLTEEVITSDGWLKTGDKGYLDKDNFLYIKGRSKNMFLGANGENIYPEAIEEKINSLLPVQESLVIENNGEIEALIYFEPEVLEELSTDKSSNEQEEAIEEILEAIRKEVNQKLPVFARIKRCRLQIEPFHKTATQKIKRYLYLPQKR